MSTQRSFPGGPSLEIDQMPDTLARGMAQPHTLAREMAQPLSDFFDIDTHQLDTDSQQRAEEALRAISDLWAEPGFLETHSFFARRILLELETLRGLLRMRSSDDLAHEALLSAISEDKSNPSLYRSLAEIQRMYSNLSTQISELIEKMERMIKDYKEHQAQTGETVRVDESSTLLSRGTKELLQQLGTD